jgi:PAS domain S-box-containing protein
MRCSLLFIGWYDGIKPGLLAVLLTLPAFKYYFVNSLHSVAGKTRAVLRLFIVSLALVPLGIMAQTSGAPPRTMRVVMDNAYAPYSFQSDDGKLRGILIDQWQAWEKKTGIKVEIHALDWGEALRRMRAGEFDVIDNIVETADRRDYFDFTPAYAASEASIFFRKDIGGISDLASLKGFPVGVKDGDQHVDQLKANGMTTVIVFQSDAAIVEAVKQHKIDVFLIDDPSALYLLNKMGIEEEFRHSAPIFRDELRRAVRKGDAATLRTVSEGFAAIDPAELKQIDEKWFGLTINRYGQYLTYAGYAAAAAILLIAILIGWNRMLRRKVLQRTAALGESEQRFRQIAEHIREVFWLSTTDFSSALYVSPAYESVWGQTRQSLYQDPSSYFASIHPEDAARVIDLLERDRDREFEIEYRVVRPDGSIRWIWDRGFPIKDEAGKFYRIAGLAEDITERKQAEEALDERLRFETLVTELSAAFANLAPNEVDREIDKWLQRLVEFLGIERATFFQSDEDCTTLYRSHTYTAPGIEPLSTPPIGMKEQFPWIMDRLRRGVTVKWSRIPDDMPDEAVKEREYAAKLGVKSGLNIPVVMGGSVICALTFASIVTYRDWAEAMVARLRLVGEIFAAAVARKHAQALLHAKDQEFRAIVENAPDLIARCDRSFRRTYVNPALAKAFDLTAEDLIGKPILSCFREAGADIEDELNQIRQRCEDVFVTGKSCEFEVAVPMPAGRRYFSLRFFPELDLNGSVVNVLAIARDLTERRLAEEELQKEKEVLEKIFESIPVMIGFVGDDGRLKLVNPEWERTMGWTLKEIQEQNVDIYADAFPDLLSRQKFRDFIANSTGKWADFKVKVRDGRVIDATCAVIHLSDGTRIGIARNITERKQAENALRQSEDRLRLAIDAIPTMVWSVRPDGIIDALNQRWLDYTGSSLEQYLKDPMGPMHPADVPGAMEKWIAHMASEEPYEAEMRLRRADGEYRWFLVRTAPLHDEQGRLVEWYGAAIDIEDRKRAEEKLKATSKQLRALSARLQSAREEEGTRIAREIHDELGSALTTLKWDLEQIESVLSDPKPGPELESMKKKARTMTRLVENTIDVVRRISADLRPSVLDDLGLVPAIEWQSRLFRERTGIAVRCNCLVDEVGLNQEQSTAVFRIFQEALTNILRHSRANGVDVTIMEKDDTFLLTIKDDGRGITDSEKYGQSAIGLLGMRERAHLVGGEIEITGSEGAGTTVTVRLPLSAPGDGLRPRRPRGDSQ